MIQGTSASISKYALVLLFNKIIEEGLFNTIRIVNFIYDEILMEVPEDMAPEWKSILEQAMIKGGTPFCPTIPLGAEGVIAPYWVH